MEETQAFKPSWGLLRSLPVMGRKIPFGSHDARGMRANGHSLPGPSARDLGSAARIADGDTSCEEAPARARGDREGSL